MVRKVRAAADSTCEHKVLMPYDPHAPRNRPKETVSGGGYNMVSVTVVTVCTVKAAKTGSGKKKTGSLNQTAAACNSLPQHSFERHASC